MSPSTGRGRPCCTLSSPLAPHPGARRAEVGRGARVRMSAMIQVAALHGVTARPGSGDPGETSVRERCGGRCRWRVRERESAWRGRCTSDGPGERWEWGAGRRRREAQIHGGGGRELGGFWGLLYFYHYNEMYSSDCHL